MAIVKIKDKEIIVDKQDVHLLYERKWYLMRARQIEEKYYLYAWIDGKTVYLHRLIMDAGKGHVVDHENRNTLDFRRNNLRIVTNAVNRINCSVRKTKKHGLPKCVYKQGKTSFKSYLAYKGKSIYLGSFKTELLAEQAYVIKRNELYPNAVT